MFRTARCEREYRESRLDAVGRRPIEEVLVTRTFTATLVLVWACAAPLVAQAPPDTRSLERIRRQLASGAPLTTAATQKGKGQPVFRIRVDEVVPRQPFLTWDPAANTAVPSYLRPRVPATHYEYLRLTTPEAFRGGALYSGGVDLLGALKKLGGNPAKRRRQREAEARKQVRDELAAFKREKGIE
jgi:hypothetical protein